jgi:hypothetical protein
MIGHLYTLLLARRDATEGPPPAGISNGGGGGSKTRAYDEALALQHLQDTERQRRRVNMAAIHMILAMAVSGELD